MLKTCFNQRHQKRYHLVGVARFERAASWTRTMHSTKLSHTPMKGNEETVSATMVLYHSGFLLSTVFDNFLDRILYYSESEDHVLL